MIAPHGRFGYPVATGWPRFRLRLFVREAVATIDPKGCVAAHDCTVRSLCQG